MFARVIRRTVVIVTFYVAAAPFIAAQTPQPASNQSSQTTKAVKPLDVDEDPAMIRMRKLNSGIIAKMSMSI